MKQHLNTLFITTEGSYLAKDGEAVAVKIDKQVRLRVPLHNLDGICCFGRVGVSPALMAACGKSRVTISFLAPHGAFRAAVVGFSPGNVLLRRTQYRYADDPARTAELARSVIAGKLVNCRTVLRRAARDATDSERGERLRTAADRLSANLIDVRARPRETGGVAEVDRLRGLEGEAARSYFATFDDLRTDDSGTDDGDAFRWTGRSKRPPKDRVNALLSFIYSLLAHDSRSACEAAGLDAAVGFLHRDRPGRPGLALDLMEEFRPYLADRLTLSLINRGQVQANGFQVLETGAVRMTDDTRKAVLVAYQERKQDAVTHPYLNEKTSIGLLIHLQARLLARWLRGDLDAYPPFLWK